MSSATLCFEPKPGTRKSTAFPFIWSGFVTGHQSVHNHRVSQNVAVQNRNSRLAVTGQSAADMQIV
jgi:hypothetical protein